MALVDDLDDELSDEGKTSGRGDDRGQEGESSGQFVDDLFDLSLGQNRLDRLQRLRRCNVPPHLQQLGLEFL